MPKKVKTKKSLDTATIATDPSQSRTSNVQSAPTAAPPTTTPTTPETSPAGLPEGRLDKLEKDQERIANLVMQIVTYMDNAQKSNQSKEPAFGNTAHPTTTATPPASPSLLNIDPATVKVIADLASKFFGGGAEQQRDPFELEIYKGMRESYVDGFKAYITTVNQNAQIGAQVLEAIKKGTLKLDAGTEQAAKT